MTNNKILTSNLIQTLFTYASITLTTCCDQSCVERQFTIVVKQKNRKRKAVANTPSPEPKKSKQIPPEPKTGSRPTIDMFASFRDKKNIPVRVLLDTGCDTSMISKQWADSHGVLLVTQMEPKIVENFNRKRVEGVGRQ
jgi:hypothetical protein